MPSIDRRTFLGATAAGLLGARLPRIAPAAGPFEVLSTDGCGRATGYAETNRIVSLGDHTHVAWLDSTDDGFAARVRTRDDTTGTWSDTLTLGPAKDNHGGPALLADGEGHLHAVFGPHHHPFCYRRSLAPDDASRWSPIEQVGARCTYPTLVSRADDSLLLTGRVSRNDGPWTVERFVRAPSGTWSDPVAILRARHRGYAHFQEALTWSPDGTLHLAARIYEGKPVHHTVGYLRSPDGGDTWEDAKGDAVELPATSATISPIAAEAPPGGLRCGSIAVDPDGVPHVLWCTWKALPGSASIASLRADGTWHQRPLRAPIDRALRAELGDEADRWTHLLPGGLTIDADGRFILVVQVAVFDDDDRTLLWGHPSTRLLRLISADGGATFTATPWSEPDRPGPHWLPSLERPTRPGQTVDAPAAIHTVGQRGTSNSERVRNRVVFRR